ncbi:hypothetical protein CROQUDRAFT_649966 [Cronartium quercuum f. sp. fusiforme G11]|uniref:Phosphatidic acid phosphatase type 2/haloperoxidase domain-containing protein n=1 Tax=Cronartium quercuum f. sp. fusiforme G11 TaxID=708437 RepID=A0A9P6NVS4_9BASI|nr:hypothetical protein CROQUDRAFT_649966 [Cronartium quercuum f. sp. fusiforme G11]
MSSSAHIQSNPSLIQNKSELELKPELSLNQPQVNHHHTLNRYQTSSPTAAGLQPDHVYLLQMSLWRFKLRKWLLSSLDKEISILEFIQTSCRSPTLDWVMIHSSWLGSHSFFILTLPLVFWFGDSYMARSQVYILAGAVYFSGAIKDFLCVPRPYAPPINRLSISNHATEYGFPSTHSATSTSTILIALEHALAIDPSHLFTKLFIFASLGLYAILLVFGRIYCGMHSIQDVICGSSLGALVWAFHRTFQAGLTSWLEGRTIAPGFLGTLPVPVLVVIFGLVMTAAHPQPIDDCPCFEDSTAFVAVTVGVMIAHWAVGNNPLPTRPFWGSLIDTNHTLMDLITQLSISITKIVIGLIVLFAWRFTLKETLSRILPPLFRLAAPLLQLPRRHYFPTSDYSAYRDELKQMKREGGLQATIIPSLLHIPIPILRHRHLVKIKDDPTKLLHPSLQNRLPGSIEKDPLIRTNSLKSKNMDPSKNSDLIQDSNKINQWKPPTVVKHHDVDVLMRLIVYAGIGFLAGFGIPVLFIYIGLDS